jgi:hypothetical protein
VLAKDERKEAAYSKASVKKRRSGTGVRISLYRLISRKSPLAPHSTRPASNAIISHKIVAEISIALKDIGADSKLLDKLQTWPVDKIYSAAEDMAAPAMLPAFIGS